jgi:hypothetical protein
MPPTPRSGSKFAAFSVINTLDVARLGLRSIEVARLQLGDIDWRSGGIILRGKATREDGTSLLADVGQALAWRKNGGPADSAWFLCVSSCRSRCQDNHLRTKGQDGCTGRLLSFVESSPR